MKNMIIYRVALLFLASYSIGFAQVLAPVLNPTAGDSPVAFPLTITCGTPGAVIRYTLNGSTPTLNDAVIASGGTITINRNWTVKAKAWANTAASATTTGVYGLTGDVSAGVSHALVLKSSGAVWAWGLQTSGRLGNNLSSSANVTSPVTSRYAGGAIGNASMVAAGADHSVVLKNDRTVWAFGNNSTGQLGDNSFTNRKTAVQVQRKDGVTDMTDCIAVAAGDGFSAALASSGEVYAWGDRTSGRLGDGNTTGTLAYGRRVYSGTSGTTILSGIGKIALAGGSALALDSADGNVWVWGANQYGQLARGNTNNLSYALRMYSDPNTLITDVTDIACGEGHTAIVRWKTGVSSLQGRVFCTGQKQYGRLGNLPASTSQSVVNSAATISYPVQVVTAGGSPLTGIVAVAAGSTHTLALDTSGQVWAWGYNGSGALGATGSSYPETITGNRGYAAKVHIDGYYADGPYNETANIVRIAAGGSGLNSYSMAIGDDGTVYTWGYNASGQLGNGAVSTQPQPTPSTVSIDLIPNPPNVALSATVVQPLAPGVVSLIASPYDPDGISNVTKVEFISNNVVLGQATATSPTPWTLSLNSLAVGNYEVYAKVTDASGLTGFSTPVSFTISRYDLPSITLTASFSHYSPNSFFLAGVPVDPDGIADIVKVEYFYNGSVIGQKTSPPWGFSWWTQAAGTFQVTAKVTDYAGHTAMSNSCTVTSGTGYESVDWDADGLSDFAELALGTSPLSVDTDGDGVSDSADLFPLDPTAWTAPLGDVTPPQILLFSPGNAVPLP